MSANILAVQKYLNRNGAKLVEDGLWGPKTQNAYDQMVQRKKIALANSSPWPRQNEAELTAFFGRHGVRDGYTPPMAKVELPMTMYLYGDKSQPLRSISVHTRIAEPYQRVVERIWGFYNEDQDELDQTGWTKFDGCYNPRPMRNGTAWSMHAWAIATDHDQDRNRLQWGRSKFWMPEEIFDLYETEGFMSLGRYRNADGMHLQATKPF